MAGTRTRCRRLSGRWRSIPTSPKPVASRRAISRRKGEQDEADGEIEEALKLDPESWEVNREAARMMFREGRIREAIPYFEKAAVADGHRLAQLRRC